MRVLVDPLRERAAVLARDGDVGVLGAQRDQLVAVAVQRQLLDDQRVQQPGEVGAGRDRVARPGLLERARAADLVAALEHEHAAPGAGEVGGGGEAVVAGADDDRVPAPGGELGGRHAPDPKRPLTFSDPPHRPLILRKHHGSLFHIRQGHRPPGPDDLRLLPPRPALRRAGRRAVRERRQRHHRRDHRRRPRGRAAVRRRQARAARHGRPRGHAGRRRRSCTR